MSKKKKKKEKPPVTGCILPWHIRNLVRTTGITYLDPIPGMLILNCLMKVYYQGDPLNDYMRKAWLRLHFPEMDNKVIETFICLTDWIDICEHPDLECMGWERLLILIAAEEGGLMHDFADHLIRRGLFKNTLKLRAKVDALIRKAGDDPPRIRRPDNSIEMGDGVEGADQCGSCSGVE